MSLLVRPATEVKRAPAIPAADHSRDLKSVVKVLEDAPPIDREYLAPREEFEERARRVNAALQRAGHAAGFVFSDEHYRGDVPYLGGNTNLSIEQVAGVVGKNGFHVAAGLEGGYVAEQLAGRAGAVVHKVEMLQLADEQYPIQAERLEQVIEAAAGGQVDHIALLTPRQVVPAGIVAYLEGMFGRDGVVDAQEIYYRAKYEKSAIEKRLIGNYQPVFLDRRHHAGQGKPAGNFRDEARHILQSSRHDLVAAGLAVSADLQGPTERQPHRHLATARRCAAKISAFSRRQLRRGRLLQRTF